MAAAGNCFGAGFDPLGRHATVVVPDLLGFGASTVAPGPLTAADHLDALAAPAGGVGLGERGVRTPRDLPSRRHSSGCIAARGNQFSRAGSGIPVMDDVSPRLNSPRTASTSTGRAVATGEDEALLSHRIRTGQRIRVDGDPDLLK